MPLRRRILLVSVALFLVGLGAVTFTTYRLLSSSLVGRLDDLLKAAAGPVAETLARTSPRHPGTHGAFLPAGSYAALLDERGRVRREARFAFGQETQRPEIPSELIRSQTLDGKPTLTTVSAASGGTEYRLLAKPLGRQGTVVVAMPLTEVNATKRLLLLIGGAVSGFVLLAIGFAAYWLTRRELMNRITLPVYALSSAAMAALSGDAPPPAVKDLVPRVAPRPLFLIYAGHGAGGEDLNSTYFEAAGEPKQLWEIPEASHTGGLAARPREYEQRVVAFFERALLQAK